MKKYKAKKKNIKQTNRTNKASRNKQNETKPKKERKKRREKCLNLKRQYLMLIRTESLYNASAWSTFLIFL